MTIRLNSLYICVKNMGRAIDFYEEILGQPVTVRDEILSIFEIHGFRFCLFDNGKVNEPVTWGDNCLPSFEVQDMEALKQRLAALQAEIIFPETKIGGNWVLEFRDSEGNDIEVYSKAR